MSVFDTDINTRLRIQTDTIIPLVGVEELPSHFKFRINLSEVGVSAFVDVSVDCIIAWFDEMVGNIDPVMMHQFIYDQLFLHQIKLGESESDLPQLLNLFISDGAEFHHFSVVAGGES